MAKRAGGAAQGRSARAMGVGTGPAGGYAVPAAYDVGTSKPKTAPKPKPKRKPRRSNGRSK